MSSATLQRAVLATVAEEPNLSSDAVAARLDVAHGEAQMAVCWLVASGDLVHVAGGRTVPDPWPRPLYRCARAIPAMPAPAGRRAQRPTRQQRLLVTAGGLMAVRLAQLADAAEDASQAEALRDLVRGWEGAVADCRREVACA